MKVPYNGKVSIETIVKRFSLKNKILFSLSKDRFGKYVTEPCQLTSSSRIDWPFVRYLKKEGEAISFENNLSIGASWGTLFETKQECDNLAENYNKILSAFRYTPNHSIADIAKNFDKFKACEGAIDKLLSGYLNYDGIDFCNVAAGGIQIRLHHKQIKGYTYGDQFTIKYDLSNIEDAPKEVAAIWENYDKADKVSQYKDFIASGEKYGWD